MELTLLGSWKDAPRLKKALYRRLSDIFNKNQYFVGFIFMVLSPVELQGEMSAHVRVLAHRAGYS